MLHGCNTFCQAGTVAPLQHLRSRVSCFIIASSTVADAGPAAAVDAPIGRPPDDETRLATDGKVTHITYHISGKPEVYEEPSIS